jgi:hypothetical protein
LSLIAAVSGGQQGETPGGRAVSTVEPAALEAQQNQNEQIFSDRVRTWEARNWTKEKVEFMVGAFACGVGFTRYLGGAAAAVALSTAATVGLGVTAATLTALDVGIAVVSFRKTTELAGIWKSEQSFQGLKPKGYRAELQKYRGGGKKNVESTTSEHIKFALDPHGKAADGRSLLYQLSEVDQHEQLNRVAEYAKKKCNRKAPRKVVEGTLSSIAFSFGVASLATGVITPPGLVLGTISLGFGVARGACKLASWAKAAFKAAPWKAQQATLGHAREQNAKALLEIATSNGAKQQPKERALAILEKLGIKPDNLSNAALRDQKIREKVIVQIMECMRS